MVDSVQFPVVVSVGTDKHPFDRLIGWVDQWAEANPEIGVFVQHGNSVAPKHAEGSSLIPHRDLLQMIARANVVVSHGGPSTVMDVRSQGRMPIVIGRNPDHGEHVDSHQMRFADHLHRHEMAICVSDLVTLHQQIDAGLSDPASLRLRVDQNAVPDGVQAFADHMNTLLNIPTEAT